MSSTSTPGSTGNSARSRPRIAAFVGLTVVLILGIAWEPADTGIPMCAVRLSTGVPCPGCGMTRGLAALLKGRAMESLEYHAFAPVVAVAAIAAWSALGIGLLAGRNLLPNVNARGVTILLIGFVASFLAYWLYRTILWTVP
jgi:hypothetical protein